MTALNRLRRWLSDNDLFLGLRNLWRWFPIIWRDRNWDAWFTYTILQKKLEFQERCLRENDLYVGVEEDCAVMRECIDLIGRIKDEKYEDELYDEHEAKWGPSSMVFCEPEVDGHGIIEFTRPNALTPEEVVQEREELRTMFEEAHRRQEAAKELLFGLLRDNIDKWWN